MAGVAKPRHLIFKAVLADHGVYSADCQKENRHTADCCSKHLIFMTSYFTSAKQGVRSRFLGLNYTPMVSVETLSRDTAP
jgi:hypothetical protein